MADTTARYSWPFQEATDPPDGAGLGQDLAEAVETTVGSIDDRVTTAETDINDLQADVAFDEARTVTKPLCILRKAAVSTGVASGGAVLTWDTEDADTAGIHAGGNPTRITPNMAGWYRFTATVHWASNATGRRGVGIRVNGGTVHYGQIVPGSSAGNLGVTVTKTLQANGSTDYFEVFAYQDSGAGLNTVDPTSTVFEAEFVRT